MKVMQAMHDKMMVAKTPEERQALMAEHSMRMMQDMGSMSDMGRKPADRQKMLKKRMDMMQSMMQMMVDCMPPTANQ